MVTPSTGQVLCDEMVVGSELSFVQSRSPCGQRLGLVRVALRIGESGEVVPQSGGARVVGSGRGGDQVESFAVDRGCCLVAAGVFVDDAESVERRRPWGHRIRGLLCADGLGDGLGENPLSVVVFSLEAVQVAEFRPVRPPIRWRCAATVFGH